MRLEVATLEHVEIVAARMRPADAAEVLASGRYGPREALEAGLKLSEMARTLFIGDEPLCMFGMVVAGDWSIPWLLTTTLVDQHPLAFWRASKLVLAELRALYPLMQQMVDGRYTQALSWARRLGFRVDDAEPFGAAGLPFHRITLGASNV